MLTVKNFLFAEDLRDRNNGPLGSRCIYTYNCDNIAGHYKLSLWGLARDDAGFNISDVSAQESWPKSSMATRKCIPVVHQVVT